jgi:hypothetical protein
MKRENATLITGALVLLAALAFNCLFNQNDEFDFFSGLLFGTALVFFGRGIYLKFTNNH